MRYTTYKYYCVNPKCVMINAEWQTKVETDRKWTMKIKCHKCGKKLKIKES